MSNIGPNKMRPIMLIKMIIGNNCLLPSRNTASIRTRNKGIHGAKKKIKRRRSIYDKRKTTINVNRPARNICHFFKSVVLTCKELKSCISISFNAPVLLYSLKYYQIHHKCSIVILSILLYNTTEELYY